MLWTNQTLINAGEYPMAIMRIHNHSKINYGDENISYNEMFYDEIVSFILMQGNVVNIEAVNTYSANTSQRNIFSYSQISTAYVINITTRDDKLYMIHYNTEPNAVMSKLFGIYEKDFIEANPEKVI